MKELIIPDSGDGNTKGGGYVNALVRKELIIPDSGDGNGQPVVNRQGVM